MKNILIAIVSALLIICFCTACYSDSIVASDSVADDLPSKVDLRNYDGKNYVTSVKRQSFGDCWSFSLAGSAEIAYLYANNMGVDAGELNDYVDFSEKYIAWYTPSSGKLLEKGVNRHTFAGYHKIDLKGEYPLKKGERYSVVLTMKRSGDDGSVVYTETFPYSTKFSTGLNVKGIVNRGESYLYHDGKWTDMSEMKDSLIEKAYRQLNEKLGSKETFTSISLDSKDTFTIDNYPIKAILAPNK